MRGDHNATVTVEATAFPSGAKQSKIIVTKSGDAEVFEVNPSDSEVVKIDKTTE